MSCTQEHKQKILEDCLQFFEADELIKLAADLVAIPGHKHVDWQEERVAQYIHEFFKKEAADEVELDYLETQRPNVIAALKGRRRSPSLLLTGHIDTVPPYDMTIPPYAPAVNQDSISGLGSVDMKGALAAMMLAMALVCRSRKQLDGRLVFAGVIDEEQRSRGTVRLVEKRLKTDWAIVGEPTGLNLCTSHLGMEWIRILIKGKSAHGSTPEHGRNAVYFAAQAALEIQRLNGRLQKRTDPVLGRPSVNLGVIHGGNDPNIVPNKCEIQVDRRWTSDELRENLYREIEDILAKIKGTNPGFQYEISTMKENVCPMTNPPLKPGSPKSPLVSSAARHIERQTGRKAAPTFFCGWSDGALLNRMLGTECIVLGPGAPSMCHADNERLDIASLIAACKIYLGVIIDLLVE